MDSTFCILMIYLDLTQHQQGLILLKHGYLQNLHQNITVRTQCDKDGA